MIRYQITSRNPGSHYFDVSIHIDNPDPDGQQLRLPNWIPGSYMIRDFARNLLDLRACNQAGELASHISRVLDIPLVTDKLRRHRNTRAQSGLNRHQRGRNVRGAFYWHGRKKPAQHIALIDDVMTTGTTVTECARVLKKAGAKRVDVWVATRAVPAGRQ